MNGAINIPAVWFDFYGRLIPGIASVIVNFGLFGIAFSTLSIAQIGAMGAMAFLIGHTVQPLSSFFARIYEDDLLNGREKIQVINSQLIDTKEMESGIQSKQFSEAVGFLSAAILFVFQIFWQEMISVNSTIMNFPFHPENFLLKWYCFPPLSILMIALGMQRVRALVRRKERVVERFGSASS